MKALLIAFLTLSSVSAFAYEFTISRSNVQSVEILDSKLFNVYLKQDIEVENKILIASVNDVSSIPLECLTLLEMHNKVKFSVSGQMYLQYKVLLISIPHKNFTRCSAQF